MRSSARECGRLFEFGGSCDGGFFGVLSRQGDGDAREFGRVELGRIAGEEVLETYGESGGGADCGGCRGHSCRQVCEKTCFWASSAMKGISMAQGPRIRCMDMWWLRCQVLNL